MPSNNRKISVTLDIGAEIGEYRKAMGDIQEYLNKLHLPESLDDDFKDIFKEYKSELANLERLTKDKELTPVNEKEVHNSVDRIEKLYKNLLVKIKSRGAKTSLLENDQEALDLMNKLQEKYKSAISNTDKELKKEESSLKKINKEINDKVRLEKKAEADQTKATKEIEKQEKVIRKLTDQRDEYNKKIKEAESDRRKIKSSFDSTSEENKGKNWYDTEDATKNLERQHEIKEQLKRVNQELADAENKLKEAQLSQAGAAEQINEAHQQVTDAQNKYADSIKNSEEKIKTLKEELDKLQSESLDNIKQELKESQVAWENYGINIDSINSFDDLKEAIDKVNESGDKAAKQGMESLLNTMEAAGINVDAFKAQLKNADQQLEEFLQQNKQIEHMRQTIVNFFSIGNAVQLFKRAIRSAFETVKDLDKVMTETAVVTDFSVADMWKQLPEYTARANKLGVTIHDVYESATLYYQQGLKTNEVMAVSNATLKMARIASLDAAEATDRMTNALRGFNMEITETNADKIADVYSKLAAISASDVDEISTAMTKTASLASNANMKFETTAAFLAQIIETTRESAETAGTALKTVIARFSEVKQLFSRGELLGIDEEGEAIDVNKVSKALRTAGIDLNEYLTGVKGLDDIFMELASKWDSLDQVQQRYIATMAAGSRQQSRFIAMMQDYKRTQELTTAANNAAGASNQQYEKTLESLESKLNRLKNSWDTFLMDIANNEIIKFVVDALNEFLTVINNISATLPQPIALFGKLWGAFALSKGVTKAFSKNGPIVSFLAALQGKDIQGGGSSNKGIFSLLSTFKKDLWDTADTTKNLNFTLDYTKTILKDQFSEGLKTAKEGIKGFGDRIKNLITVLGPAALKIGAVALVGWSLVQIFKDIKASTPQGKLENLNEALKDSQNNVKETSSEYSNLKNSIEALDESKATLNGLVIGTTEWKEQLIKVNEQVLQLIQTYPELMKTLKIDENGQLSVDSSELQNQFKQRALGAILTNANLQNRQQKSEIESARSNLINSIDPLGGNLREKAYDEWFKNIGNGTKTIQDFKNELAKINITLSSEVEASIYEYNSKLLQLNNSTTALSKNFISSVKGFMNLTEEEEKAIDNINSDFIKVIQENAEKSGKKLYEDKAYDDYGNWNYNVLKDYLKDLGYRDVKYNPFTQNYTYTTSAGQQTSGRRELEQEYISYLGTQDIPKTLNQYVNLTKDLPEWIQKIIENPEGVIQNKEYTQELFEKEIPDALEKMLESWGFTLDDIWNRYKNNEYSEERIDQTQINRIKNSNKEINENEANELYGLLKNTGLGSNDINNIINSVFSGSVDLNDVEAIEKMSKSLTTLGMTESQAKEFIDKLIEFANATLKVDPNKFATMSKFVEDMQNTDTFSKENYEELIKTYGFSASDFIQIGDEYKLNIDNVTQEEFNQKLNEFINNLFMRYLTQGVGDEEDFAALQRTAGYNASKYSDIGKTEDYYKGARSSFMSSEAGKNYVIDQGSLAASVKGNKELSNALTSSANAASKLLPKFKELTEVIKDNAEALQEEDLKAIAEVTKAFNKAFGTNLSEEFVKENKSILIDFANGVGDAYDRISDKVLQTFIDKDSTEQNLRDIYTFIQGINWDINGQFILDDGPFLNTIKGILDAGGAAAEQLEAALKAAGITITWTTDYENIEIGWNEKGPIYEQVPKRHVATLTNALQQQQTVNAKSGGGKSSGGGGSSKPKYWDNPYDELYNLIEKQNEALRVRERLERDYDRILKNRDKTAKELLQNSLNEIANLRKEIQIQEQIQAGRRRMIGELGTKGTYRNSEGQEKSFNQWGVTRYASYDYNTNTITIDWAGIDQINDPDKGGAVEAYISKLEELTQSFEETQDQIEEMKDIIQEIKERNMQEYLDFEQRAYDAVIARQQKMIDDYSALSDTISESNNRIVDSLRESIDMERQIRDNTKTEEDIADKEARLEYLRRDTSGANQTEILKLEEELRNSRESYGDTLVDQAIDQLQKDNDLAAEQRSQQIEIMQAQLNWQDKTGYYWEEVYKLIDSAFDENGKVIEDSPLFNLLRQTEDYQRLSKYGKENFDTEGNEQAKQAYEGLYNWDHKNDPEPVPEPITETSTAAAPLDPAHGNIASAGQLTPINSRRYSAAVERFQQGINDLINAGQLSISPIGVDGYYGNETFRAVKALQSAIGVRADGYWGPNSVAAFNSSSLKRYAKGGLVNSTGLAWLDGTKSAPEMVLSARDTENFIALRNALAQMLAQGIGGKGGDNYFDIQISVDELGSDYDVDQLADRIKKQIYDDSSYRNVNAISYLR